MAPESILDSPSRALGQVLHLSESHSFIHSFIRLTNPTEQHRWARNFPGSGDTVGDETMMMPSWSPQSPRARVSTEGITNIQQGLETLLIVTTGGMLLASRRKPGFLLNILQCTRQSLQEVGLDLVSFTCSLEARVVGAEG